jgi:hypothetical protein
MRASATASSFHCEGHDLETGVRMRFRPTRAAAKMTGIARIALDHGQPFVRARDLLERTDERGDRVAARQALVN